MGGGSYDRDTYSGGSSSSFYSGGSSSTASHSALRSSRLHKDMDPKKRIIQMDCETPIIIALDVTGSNIEFARVAYDKAPMLHGQIEQKGYATDHMISFSAVGDAYSDDAPVQMADLEYGDKIEEWLKKLYLESGGGGQVKESYELMAYNLLVQTSMSSKVKNPFCFFIVDEAPYMDVNASQVKSVLGLEMECPMSTREVFDQLLSKFHENVFILQNPYSGRDTEKSREIREIWHTVINPEHVIYIPKEQKGIIDIILGIIAIRNNSRNIDTYTADLTSRDQTKDRIATVSTILKKIKPSMMLPSGQWDGNLPTARSTASRRSSSSTRL